MIMSISFQDQVQLTCPACSAEFDASIWLIIDAHEAPQAVEALQRGELNQVACPACEHTGPAGAPLLFHDGQARRVIFAGAPGSSDHEIRDQARELHAVLVGSIPEDQRRAYLADVDIAQDLDGMALLLKRMARRRPPEAELPPTPTPPPTEATLPPLMDAVQALLAADTPDQLSQVLAEHPALLEPATDAALANLADVAREQQAPDIADSLQRARTILSRMSDTVPTNPATPIPPEALLQAVLATTTTRELAELAQANPQLLQPETDRLLADAIDQALETEHERLAQELEARREALVLLRTADPAAATQSASLEEAIEALLIAEDPTAISAAIEQYPILLDEVAREALWQFASEARASGDEEMAAYAIECREMLRRVREGLEQ